MNICCECEHYRRAVYLPLTEVWVDPSCRSIDVRRKYKSVITGVPKSIYCKRVRQVDNEPDKLVTNCPYWSEKRIKPAPAKKRPWYRRLFREGE